MSKKDCLREADEHIKRAKKGIINYFLASYFFFAAEEFEKAKKAIMKYKDYNWFARRRYAKIVSKPPINTILWNLIFKEDSELGVLWDNTIFPTGYTHSEDIQIERLEHKKKYKEIVHEKLRKQLYDKGITGPDLGDALETAEEYIGGHPQLIKGARKLLYENK